MLRRRQSPTIRPRMFISYSHRDQDFILRLEDDLRRAQIDPWLDVYEVHPGASISDAVFNAGIENADIFFAYLSENAVKSAWVDREMRSILGDLGQQGISVALYVDTDERRSLLRRDWKDFNVPMLNEENYGQVLPQLVSAAWMSIQSNQKVVPSRGHLFASTDLYRLRPDLQRLTLLDEFRDHLIIVGPNLRSWLSDRQVKDKIISVLRNRPGHAITLIMGTYPILKELGALGNEGARHLYESALDVEKILSELEPDEAARFTIRFHSGAATLSAVFTDPNREDGIAVFTPRWGIDYQPNWRISCLIERTTNPELYQALYGSVFVFMQANEITLSDMLNNYAP